MFNFIYSYHDNKYHSIFSKKGKKILKTYLKTYYQQGSSEHEFEMPTHAPPVFRRPQQSAMPAPPVFRRAPPAAKTESYIPTQKYSSEPTLNPSSILLNQYADTTKSITLEDDKQYEYEYTPYGDLFFFRSLHYGPIDDIYKNFFNIRHKGISMTPLPNAKYKFPSTGLYGSHGIIINSKYISTKSFFF